MAVNNKHKKFNSVRGQSLIEFAFFLPFFLTLFYHLIHVNLAINAGVVFQQFTQGRMLQMLYNHADYPLLRFVWSDSLNEPGRVDKFYIGMDRDTHDPDVAGEREDKQPIAPEILIDGRNANMAAPGDDDPFPPVKRKKVRVRILSFICMPPKFVPGQNNDTQAPRYVTEYIYGKDTWYAGGFGSHVVFCNDQNP